MSSKKNNDDREKRMTSELASLAWRRNLNLKQFGHHSKHFHTKLSVVYKTTYKQATGAPLGSLQRQTEVSYNWS